MIIAEFSKFCLIMVHIPKAAGSALRLSLRKHKDSAQKWTEFMYLTAGIDKTHASLYSEYIQSYVPKDLPLVVVASIRNPYDRIYSAFIFNQRTLHYKRNNITDPRLEWFKRPFLEFVKLELSKWVIDYRETANQRKEMNPIGIHFAPISLFLLNDFKIKQFYIRQESFEGDFKRFCQEFDLSELDSVTCHCANGNKPPDVHQYLKHYDEEGIKIINELYADEFKYFGYLMID